jgi:hypothetical protein
VSHALSLFLIIFSPVASVAAPCGLTHERTDDGEAPQTTTRGESGKVSTCWPSARRPQAPPGGNYPTRHACCPPECSAAATGRKYSETVPPGNGCNSRVSMASVPSRSHHIFRTLLREAPPPRPGCPIHCTWRSQMARPFVLTSSPQQAIAAVALLGHLVTCLAANICGLPLHSKILFS